MVLTLVSYSYIQNIFKNDRPTFKFRKTKEWRAPGEGICFRGANLNIWQGNLRCKRSTGVANPSSSVAIPEQDFRYRVEWHNSVMRVTRVPLSMRRVITYSARAEAAAARRRPESASERTNDANYYYTAVSTFFTQQSTLAVAKKTNHFRRIQPKSDIR